jgi:hypothetical protein
MLRRALARLAYILDLARVCDLPDRHPDRMIAVVGRALRRGSHPYRGHALEPLEGSGAVTGRSTAASNIPELFAGSGSGLHLRGAFVNYPIDLGFALRQGQVASDEAKRISDALRHIVWDIWNVGTLLERLEWADGIAATDSLEEGLWNRYCSLDIEHFHIEIRSILDYAATCISAVARSRGTAPPDSMSKLLNWLQTNPGNVKRLGADLAVLVPSLPAFVEIRDVRDGTVHRGALTMLYGKPSAGLIFQVHQRFTAMLKPRFGVVDDGLINFRRYDSQLFAEVLLFLDGLMPLLWDRIPVKHVGLGDAVFWGPGLNVLFLWLGLREPEGSATPIA